MVQTTQKVTQKMIDAVFANEKLRRQFPNPERAKAICDARLGGNRYTDIGIQYGVSQYTCIQCVRKVIRLYRIFIEGEQT